MLVTGGVWPSGALMYVETNHPAEPRQRPTATLPEDRKDHQATRLPSGNVLVTGGLLASAPGTPNAGALRYRPEVGAGSAVWLATAAMIQPRQSHTQTLLPGTGTHGRVLVAGGFSGPQGWQDSAEIYDEATNAWTRTLPMLHKHSGHTATLLADGSVLVAGGSDGPQASAYTETYAPAGNQWQAAGSMGSQREFHTATLLADGRVSLFIAEPDGPGKNPLALQRMNLQGKAAVLAPTDSSYEAVRQRYQEKFPQSKMMFGFGDFSLWELKMQDAHLVLGFGQAYTAQASAPATWKHQAPDKKP